MTDRALQFGSPIIRGRSSHKAGTSVGLTIGEKVLEKSEKLSEKSEFLAFAIGRWLMRGEADTQKATKLMERIGSELSAQSRGAVLKINHDYLARHINSAWLGRHSRLKDILYGQARMVQGWELRDLAVAAETLRHSRLDREYKIQKAEMRRLEVLMSARMGDQSGTENPQPSPVVGDADK